MLVKRYTNVTKLVLLGLFLIISSGCATTQNTEVNGIDKYGDPIEPTNRFFYDVNDALDRNLITPAAEAYVSVTPEPVRKAVTNFFPVKLYGRFRWFV